MVDSITISSPNFDGIMNFAPVSIMGKPTKSYTSRI
jgi:hypothetical protein